MLGEGGDRSIPVLAHLRRSIRPGNVADAKFPGQTGGCIPPSPTIGNPGQVYPQSDPQAASQSTVPGTSFRCVLSSITSNSYLFEDDLRKIDTSLCDLIRSLENEEAFSGSSCKRFRYLQKFRNWKKELLEMRDPQSRFNLTSEGGGEYGLPSEGGGLFVE